MRPTWADPTEDLFRLRERLYRLLDASFVSEQAVQPPGSFSPNVDILATDEQVIMLVEVPGMNRDDLSVQVRDSVVTIAGERTLPGTDGEFHRRERRAGRFSRSFSLAYELDPDTVAAKLEDGLLRVTVQRRSAGTQVAVQ